MPEHQPDITNRLKKIGTKILSYALVPAIGLSGCSTPSKDGRFPPNSPPIPARLEPATTIGPTTPLPTPHPDSGVPVSDLISGTATAVAESGLPDPFVEKNGFTRQHFEKAKRSLVKIEGLSITPEGGLESEDGSGTIIANTSDELHILLSKHQIEAYKYYNVSVLVITNTTGQSISIPYNEVNVILQNGVDAHKHDSAIIIVPNTQRTAFDASEPAELNIQSAILPGEHIMVLGMTRAYSVQNDEPFYSIGNITSGPIENPIEDYDGTPDTLIVQETNTLTSGGMSGGPICIITDTGEIVVVGNHSSGKSIVGDKGPVKYISLLTQELLEEYQKYLAEK